MQRTSTNATLPRRNIPAMASATLLVLLASCSDGPTQPAEGVPVQVAAVSGDGQFAQPGKKLRKPLVVRVTDAKGTGVGGVSVAWSADGGTMSTAASRTDARGRAEVEWTLAAAGQHTATATARGLPPVAFVGTAAHFPNATVIDTLAIVLEYASVYDVHEEPDPINYSNLRIQRGGFEIDSIRRHLEQVIDPAGYDFVLLYTLHEVPGWIFGGYAHRIVAKNIGHWNQLVSRPASARWPRLRSMPHMNNLRFIVAPEHAGDPQFGPLTAIHEMGHAWLAHFTGQNAIGPWNWQGGRDPVAYLASSLGHWTTNWLDAGMPGIMASKPTSARFNAFDLYALGLMGYEEARQYSYRLFEGTGEAPRNPVIHEITVDSLIAALRIRADAGGEVFEDDGRRIPDTDPEMAELQVLLVVVKGADETFTEQDHILITTLARQISQAWRESTWGRSQMRVVVRPAAGAAR